MNLEESQSTKQKRGRAKGRSNVDGQQVKEKEKSGEGKVLIDKPKQIELTSLLIEVILGFPTKPILGRTVKNRKGKSELHPKNFARLPCPAGILTALTQ